MDAFNAFNIQGFTNPDITSGIQSLPELLLDAPPNPTHRPSPPFNHQEPPTWGLSSLLYFSARALTIQHAAINRTSAPLT